MFRRGLPLAATILVVVGAPSIAYGTEEEASAATTCDRYAAPDGSDSAPGSLSSPYATATKLVASLAPGQVGCLRAGTYGFASLAIKTARVTLRPYESEAVTLKGSLRINPGGRGTVIEGLRLNGDGPDSKHGPNVYADEVVLRNNEITNDNTGICVQIARYYDEPAPRNVVVENNRIHHCGALPRTNLHHGIYNSAGIDAVIRHNWIYSNADRGIQLYPAAEGTLITGNVIDRNTHGLNFSCNSSKCSRRNVAQGNVIANNSSWNVYGHSQGATPDGSNVLRDNCTWKGSGSDGVDSDTRFFSESGNRTAQPGYVDATHSDYRLVSGSVCTDMVAGSGPPPAEEPPASDPTNPDPSKPPKGKGKGKVVLRTSTSTVAAGEIVALKGTINAKRRAGRNRKRAVVQVWRDGRWQRHTARRVSGRRFIVRRRLAVAAGRLHFRAKVKRVGRSRPVRVTVVG